MLLTRVGTPLDGRLQDLVDGRRGEIYAALISLQATLLGFVLASLTIVLGYISNSNFALVRESGHFRTLFTIFIAGTRTTALGTSVSLMALLFDTESDPAPYLAASVTALAVIASTRIARVLWVTRLVVLIAIRP